MRKILLCFAMAATVLVLPQVVKADEPEKAGPPSPEMLFKHFDVNHDGAISEDEIPAYAPEPLKDLLKAADKNGDKKVSLEEFMAAVKEHPLPEPPGGRHGRRDGMPPFGPGGPGMDDPRHGPPGPPHDGPRGKAPDLKELFGKFDKDKDGKLTQDEFTEGMKQMHKAMTEHAGPRGPMPGCPMQGGPMQGGPMPPPPPMFGMMPQHGGPGPWMMGGPMPGSHGNNPCPAGGECPHMKGPAGNPPPPREKDGKALDARFKELEAKVKALEDKLQAK
jgi:hypothetical protein